MLKGLQRITMVPAQRERTMDYKFDGTTLRDRIGNKIAVFDGKVIRDARGNKLGSVEGTALHDARGLKLAVFDGRVVTDARGTRIGTMSEIQKSIDGPGGMSLVGLWFLLVR
jgi:hypothetical protein